jgi:cytochrome c553
MDKQRPHPTMHAQAATMTDQDMQDLAAYFSSFPAK